MVSWILMVTTIESLMLIGYGVLLPWSLPLKANLSLMVSFMQRGPGYDVNNAH